MPERGTTMDGAGPPDHERLVDALANGLAPVRRLPAPWLRGLGWFVAASAIGLAGLPWADTDALTARMTTPDLCLAAIGAAVTALAAAVAAFQTSVPGRSPLWALLPLPPAAVWIGASGLGCLRQWTVPGTQGVDADEMGGCFVFLLGVSIPLSLALVVMLRKACPLRPNLTMSLGGLAAAAAAATLLVPFHPHDATATDLALHLVVVLIVIGANGLAGGRLLAGEGSA